MQAVVEAGSVPLILRVVEHGLDRVRDVDDASRITRDDKQEPVRSLQYQMLELLVGEEGWLVGSVCARVTRAWNRKLGSESVKWLKN